MNEDNPHVGVGGIFSKPCHVDPQRFRLSTAGDLVASAAEGPERLKTELKLYRQQLEQAGQALRMTQVL